MEGNDEGGSDPELMFSCTLKFSRIQNGISESDSLVDVPPADYVGSFKIDSFRLHMPIIRSMPITRSMPYITACAYLTLPQVHLQQPALSTSAIVRAVPRSIWSLSISTSSSPTTNHQVEEEATLSATPIASLTETLAMNFNEVQRRGIRNDASLSPTPFHRTTSTGPREAAWLPWTRSRSNHLSSSTVLGILQSLPISGPMLPIWAQFLFPGCVPSHSSQWG